VSTFSRPIGHGRWSHEADPFLTEIVWLFTNYAIYALSTPALGEPVYGMPKQPWPPRG